MSLVSDDIDLETFGKKKKKKKKDISMKELDDALPDENVSFDMILLPIWLGTFWIEDSWRCRLHVIFRHCALQTQVSKNKKIEVPKKIKTEVLKEMKNEVSLKVKVTYFAILVMFRFFVKTSCDPDF